MSESDKAIKLVVRNSREENIKESLRVLKESEEAKVFESNFEKRFKMPMIEAKQKLLNPGFSWKQLAHSMGTTVKEADSGSSFSQMLRAGVQLAVNQMYEQVDTSYEDWAHVIQSKKDTELYAPLHGISFLREIGKQEIYPESRAAGLDIKLKNRKYGTMYPIEKELVEDDQTGQFIKMAGLMGEYARLALEVICMAKLTGVAGSYADLAIPATETKPDEESTYPFSTALVGGGANRPASFGILNNANLQSGYIGLMNQKNKLGLKMMVQPKRILVGPQYAFDAPVLLNSAYFPAVPSATAGATGANFAINPVKGLANLTVSRFMFKNDGTVSGDSKAWYLMDDSKPWFVLQLRESAKVEQEAPTSGDSFNKDIFRFKVSLRANADHIDPRFCWQGNDGSVTS